MTNDKKIIIKFTCSECGLEQEYKEPDFYTETDLYYGHERTRIYTEYQCSKCKKRYCEEVH